MEIEHKNVAYANNGIYRVGNVISRIGMSFMVVKTRDDMYCFVDLNNGEMFTPKCATLKLLAGEFDLLEMY